MKRLVRVARYLEGQPNLGVWLPQSKKEKGRLIVKLRLWSDANRAAPDSQRKSVSCGVIEASGCVLHSYSRRQSVISLSSAESEFYVLSAVALEGRLFARILELFGSIVKSYALTDSSAAKGISQREGVGKVRHMDTRALWLQAEVKLARLTMLKIGTEDNLADIGTKGHNRETPQKLIELNSLIASHVEEHPETIAACATSSAASSTVDLRRSHRRLPSHRRCKSEHVHQRH
jgi:hypothetical protein